MRFGPVKIESAEQAIAAIISAGWLIWLSVWPPAWFAELDGFWKVGVLFGGVVGII